MMSGSVNKVILVGNLGHDPEIRMMQNGNRVCNMSVATSERWKGQDGQQQERTEWHRVVIFDDKLCDVAEKYLNSGAKVYLEGSLQTRKWSDQSGVEKYSTEVVLQKFRGVLVMLDSIRTLDDPPAPQQPQGSSAPPAGGLGDEIPWMPDRGL